LGFRNLFILDFPGWEVDLQNSIGVTNSHTFPAKRAFFSIDVGKILSDGNGSEIAHLQAFLTARAGHLASLGGCLSLLLVPAGDKNLTVFGHLFPKFQQQPGTSSNTSAASIAFQVVDFG
jgi:hypothetical protein